MGYKEGLVMCLCEKKVLEGNLQRWRAFDALVVLLDLYGYQCRKFVVWRRTRICDGI